jgi:hypothetical protein
VFEKEAFSTGNLFAFENLRNTNSARKKFGRQLDLMMQDALRHKR